MVVLDVQNVVEDVDGLEVVAARGELVDEEAKMVMTIENLEAVRRHVREARSGRHRCRQGLAAVVLDYRRSTREERK